MKADAPATLTAQLRQAQWQIEVLHTLIDQLTSSHKTRPV